MATMTMTAARLRFWCSNSRTLLLKSRGGSCHRVVSSVLDVQTPHRSYAASAAALSSPSSLPYHLVVGLPALSPTMSSGSLAEWYVGVGDGFRAGDAIAKIETDKASIDFEAQDDGYVAKLLQVAGSGDLPVGTPIFITVEEADDVAAFENYQLPPAAEKAAAAAPAPPAAPKAEKATPPAPAPESKKPIEAPPKPEAPPKEKVAAAPQQPPKAAAAPPTPSPSPAKPTAPATASVVWGFAAKKKSPLASSLAAQQKAYIERYGTTGQRPLV